jgi:LacI family transcriptional regulator
VDNISTKNKKTTIYDIAVEVGTSAATVSRVLSNSGYPVKEEVRDKILEASERMNYSPNIIGRMLKKSESMDIGVIIPTISNPFYSQIILGIELEARQRGFNILLCNSFREAEAEKKYMDSLYQKQVRGIIVSSIDENHVLLGKMQQSGVKVVIFDQNIDDVKFNRVGFDYMKGGMLAVEYLIAMGHRNIAFVTAPLIRRSRKETMDGYKFGLIKNGVEFKEENVIASSSEEEAEGVTYEFENGRKLVRRFLELKERPTAIFAVNDMTAFGIIQELVNNGIRVPEDVSIIGFDNIEFSSMISPPLTTINQPSFQTGKLACKMLLDSISDESYGEEVCMLMEPSLVVRKSVRRLKVE